MSLGFIGVRTESAAPGGMGSRRPAAGITSNRSGG